jgi:hypothetical protein
MVDEAPGLAVGRHIYIDENGDNHYSYYLKPDDINVHGSP